MVEVSESNLDQAKRIAALEALMELMVASMKPASFSITEKPQYWRLVDFVCDVSRHADETGDLALVEKVDDLQRDLLEMSGDE